MARYMTWRRTVGTVGIALLITSQAWMSAAEPTTRPATSRAHGPSTRPVDRKDDPKLALLWAIVKRDTALARELIRQGADVNAQDSSGNTPLFYAAGMEDSLVLMEELIAKGAKVNARCIGGFTPLHQASFRSQPAAATALIAHGADVNALEASEGSTPLHVAVDSYERYHTKDSLKVISILVSHNADVNSKDKTGKSPMDYAGSAARKLMERPATTQPANRP